jgi:tetratricopeptide (TPR) repeat protein
VAKYLNDYGRAMALLEESMEIKRTRGDVAGTAASLANLGNLAMLQQDYKRAAILYQESLSLKRESGDLLAIITSLDQMGELALVQGHFVRSARLFGAAEKMRQTLQVPRTPSIQTAVFGFLTSLQQHLAADVFAASWAEGEAMPLEKAVAYALAE